MKRYIFAALFFLFGGTALYMGFHVGGEIAEKRDWPTVPGKIMERRVGEAISPKRNYMPYVKYQYDVAGKHYINDQVYLIKRTGGLHDEIQKLVDGLPDPVPVHYNPKEPGESFLLVNPVGTKWLLVAAGGFALLMGLAQLLVAVTKKSQAKPA
jgi:hypothetical protein